MLKVEETILDNKEEKIDKLIDGKKIKKDYFHSIKNCNVGDKK